MAVAADVLSRLSGEERHRLLGIGEQVVGLKERFAELDAASGQDPATAAAEKARLAAEAARLRANNPLAMQLFGPDVPLSTARQNLGLLSSVAAAPPAPQPQGTLVIGGSAVQLSGDPQIDNALKMLASIQLPRVPEIDRAAIEREAQARLELQTGQELAAIRARRAAATARFETAVSRVESAMERAFSAIRADAAKLAAHRKEFANARGLYFSTILDNMLAQVDRQALDAMGVVAEKKGEIIADLAADLADASLALEQKEEELLSTQGLKKAAIVAELTREAGAAAAAAFDAQMRLAELQQRTLGSIIGTLLEAKAEERRAASGLAQTERAEQKEDRARIEVVRSELLEREKLAATYAQRMAGLALATSPADEEMRQELLAAIKANSARMAQLRDELKRLEATGGVGQPGKSPATPPPRPAAPVIAKEELENVEPSRRTGVTLGKQIQAIQSRINEARSLGVSDADIALSLLADGWDPARFGIGVGK